MTDYIIEYTNGFYDEESNEEYSFRWMGNTSTLSFSGNLTDKKYLKIRAGHSNPSKIPQLSISQKDRIISRQTINPYQNEYCFDISSASIEAEMLNLKLTVDNTYHVEGDGRLFGLMIIEISLLSPTDMDILFDGYYPSEQAEYFQFNWIQTESSLLVQTDSIKEKPYLSFYAASEFKNFSQVLTISTRSKGILKQFPLLHDWNRYHVDLSDFKDEKNSIRLILTLNKAVRSSGDKRDLGIRVANFHHHDSSELMNYSEQYNQNAILNRQEFLSGKSRLNSFPRTLGIDLIGKCNISPPCVYCLWDHMKELEGDNADIKIDADTFRNYGPFFHHARNMVNCSFGEPMLHSKLHEILAFFSEHDKFIEISTNGQAFTKQAIDAIAGKNITMYVSLDAATKDTYAKIRNDKWDTILPKLMMLKEARRKNRMLPRIYMVFMPMRVNINEFEAYFELCREIEVNALVLRPLNFFENYNVEVERGGYRFNYKDEMLTHEEIRSIIKEGERLSSQYGIPFINQFEFGEQKDQ